MALGSIKNGEEQPLARWQYWELLSDFAHFLHFFDSSLLSAFAASRRLSLAKRGERSGKHAVHRIVHPRVHPGESSKSRREEKLDAQRCEFWAHARHGSGLERPRLFAACAPKRVLGVVPAHTRARNVSTMQVSAISIP